MLTNDDLQRVGDSDGTLLRRIRERTGETEESAENTVMEAAAAQMQSDDEQAKEVWCGEGDPN